MSEPTKTTGVLLAVSSLPSPYGIGDLGATARGWIDLLHQNGVRIWQILPLNPTGYGNSPYQPYSSCAGEELYLSLEQLAQQGLLPQPPIPFAGGAQRVDYQAVRTYKEPFLRAACAAFVPDAEYQAFVAQPWVQEYAVFRAFKKANEGRCWLQWPQWQRAWPETRTGALQDYRAEIDYQLFLQYQFVCQWQAVRDYARQKEVRIMGDVPFYVGVDSVDVWAHKSNFLLGEDGSPVFIAGVPPDYFSATGQRWGNPIYDWDYMAQNQFDFWVKRIGYNQTLFDIIRIDHFRAFDTYWKIPASCPTAIEGEWVEAPGYAVLDTLYCKIPKLELVAEDLGDLRPEVLALRDHYNLKGMKVQQFSLIMSGKTARDAEPQRQNQIYYTGTHDNATLCEWYQSLTPPARRKLRRWLHRQGCGSGTVVQRLIAVALAAPAQWTILPLQDIMELGATARMNTPGTVGAPNWQWRLTALGAAAAALQKYKPLITARSQQKG